MALQTKTFNVVSNTFTLLLTLTENSTNISSNTSSLSYKLELISTTKDFYSFKVGASFSIDNRVIASRDRASSPQINLPVRSRVTLLSGSTTVAHGNQGNKTIAIKYTLDMAKTSYTPGALSGSGSMPLTVIPRGATLSNAPNFNDEENPKVEFNNPAKVQVQLGIFKDSTTPLANYRVVSGSPYTFSLTEQERKALRSVDKTKNMAQVRFYIKSTVGGKDFITYLTRTLTIKNPAPTLNPTVEDENPVTLALTGDKTKMVKYHSNAKVTMGAKAVKEATISRTSVDCGGKSLSADGTITGVESGSFLFAAVDSRGNVTSKEITRSLVAYVKPTAHIGEGRPDGTGTYEFNVFGSCFAGSFGIADNELTLEYHYKALGSAVWGTWTPMTLTPKGTQYTASAIITGLNYQVKYEFQARITDKLGQSLSEVRVVTSIPGWDWGENDFNFNMEVFLTQHFSDGSTKKRGLARCGMTAQFWRGGFPGMGEISSRTVIPMQAVRYSYGDATLSDGGIKVSNTGVYLVSGAVHYSDGPDNAWCGVGVDVPGGNGNESTSFVHIPAGLGTVMSQESIVALNAGDVVKLRAEPTVKIRVNADVRTRLTVVQLY